jgi:arsenite-transporting ATPase
VHNIIINQVLFPEAANGSRLLAARIRMQQRYLSQFHDLYEDFHLVELPLLAEEVRGVPALRDFSALLVSSDAERRARAVQADGGGTDDNAELLQLREENAALRAALTACGGQL